MDNVECINLAVYSTVCGLKNNNNMLKLRLSHKDIENRNIILQKAFNHYWVNFCSGDAKSCQSSLYVPEL